MMLRCQFLCHVLKASFFNKIGLKLSYFRKKMQNFQALGAPLPDLRASGGWGRRPQSPKIAPHCKFLATRLNQKRRENDASSSWASLCMNKDLDQIRA